MTSRIRNHTLFAAGAVLMLAACNAEGEANETNVADAAPAGNEVAMPSNEAAAPAELAPAAAGALSADYLVGKWSAINEDCSETLEFREGGTVMTPIGDAKWSVAGDKLTIDYGDGSTPTTTTIKPLGSDRIEITTASGRKENQKRC